ncbi:MAG TPA: hypothetical protein VLH86_01760 [Patescibacteria group bacterium]|nr:hypothetical protein [Patescibacteria group bacterium]
MGATTLAVLGVSSAVLQFVSVAPYFVDILKGKTKPERATWWIWLLLNFVSFGAQVGAGATWSLFMTGGQLIVTGAIAGLSLKYGYGSFHKKDTAAIVTALLGIFLWWLLNSPLAALLVVILVDLVGYYLTLEKTWKAPHTETLATWAIGAVSAALGVLAVGSWSLTKCVYPLYVAFGNALLALVIITRRPVVDKHGAPHEQPTTLPE